MDKLTAPAMPHIPINDGKSSHETGKTAQLKIKSNKPPPHQAANIQARLCTKSL
jgi:hypothetical protein